MRAPAHCLVIETLWGWCGAWLRESGLAAFRLPCPTAAEASAGATGPAAAYAVLRTGEPAARAVARTGCRHAEALAEDVRDYFSGRFRGFRVPLDWDCGTPFQRSVWRLTAEIAPGQTLTYGELAARLGSGNAARAVGGALAANPTPLIVPCHRVTGAGGKLCGFSAPGGTALKRRLLEWESPFPIPAP